MKTVNKYGIEFAGQRRVKRSGWMTVATALTVLTLITAVICWLVWLVYRASTAGDVMPVMGGMRPALRAAGFGLPEWVAYGVVGTLTMSVLGLAAWNVILPRRTQCDEVASARWQQEVMDEGLHEPWQQELSEWFKQRDVWISAKNARQIKALAQPDHVMALPMLDSYLRRELGLRLFVTSLMEIQAICGKGVAA